MFKWPTLQDLIVSEVPSLAVEGDMSSLCGQFSKEVILRLQIVGKSGTGHLQFLGCIKAKGFMHVITSFLFSITFKYKISMRTYNTESA